MSLTRIDNPTPSAPAALADYVQILAKQTNAILQSLRNNSHACIDFANNFARAGVVFHVAGVLYKAVTDQAISGTPSKYVKITPSGATATIAYVASLAGVTWDDEQSGYYDGSGNLYVFDEARAVYDGVVSSPKTDLGQIAYIAGSLSVKSGLTVLGDISIGDDAEIGGDLTLDGNLIFGGDTLVVLPNIVAKGTVTSTTPASVYSIAEGAAATFNKGVFLVAALPTLNSAVNDAHVAIVTLNAQDLATASNIQALVAPGTALISSSETNTLGVRRRHIDIRALSAGVATTYYVMKIY